MEVIVMGSGTSTGVPVIGCHCQVCENSHPKNSRTRASIAVNFGSGWYVIDTGPDFRTQVLAAKITGVKGVLYTHIHADHCHGFDDLRAFAFRSSYRIPCYLLQEHLEEFKVRFAYAFRDTGYIGAKPLVDLKPIPKTPFDLDGRCIEPIRLPHGSFTTCGFKIGRFAYLTDFKGFPEDWVEKWRGEIDTMVASGIHFNSHPSHNNIEETCHLFNSLDVGRGIITHLSHNVDIVRDSKKLPEGCEFAYDGMVIDV